MAGYNVRKLLKALPRALERLREDRGFRNQRDLARETRALGIPVPHSSVARYERGVVSPNLESLGRLCEALDVGWTELGNELLQVLKEQEAEEAADAAAIEPLEDETEGEVHTPPELPVELTVQLGDYDPEQVAVLLRRLNLYQIAVPGDIAERLRRSVRRGGGEPEETTPEGTDVQAEAGAEARQSSEESPEDDAGAENGGDGDAEAGPGDPGVN